MELLVQHLPSGNPNYSFQSIRIKPMTFAQILEYMENVPSNEVEKFYFDYKVVLEDDPNIDNLLLCDLEYVVFFKKCLTISKDLDFKITATCPECGNLVSIGVKLSEIKFNHLDPVLLNGLSVDFEGSYHAVRMPTVQQFMQIFSKYRLYKKVTDMRIIKLIALFEQTEIYLQKYETMVINATYQGVALLTMLDNLYYKVVEPLRGNCRECQSKFENLKLLKLEQLELSDNEEDKALYKAISETKYGGMAIGIDSLIANFFRDVVENNRLADAQVVPREIRQD